MTEKKINIIDYFKVKNSFEKTYIVMKLFNFNFLQK